jgi:hypothetical protein
MQEQTKPGTDHSGGVICPLGADLIIPLLALGFAIYFFFSIRELAWEAKANGVMIGSLLVLLVAVQVARIALRVFRGQASLGFDALLEPREAFWPRIGLVAVVIVFIATIKWLGVTLGLFLGMLASLRLLGIRRPRVLFGIAAIVALSVYVLFIAILDASFPHGPIENLLAPLTGRA